jgi:hypothetical protein
VRALIWPLFTWSAWAHTATVVAGTSCGGAVLASVRSVGVGSASHCGRGHHMRGRCFCLCSLCRRGIIQPLRCRARQVRALLWPLFARSEWAQPATVVEGTTGEGAAPCSVRLVGVSSESHCCGGTTGDALIWPPIACLAWTDAATEVASSKDEGAGLASVRSVGVGRARHCGDEQDRRVHCSGLCYFGRRRPSQPLWWRTRRVWALF